MAGRVARIASLIFQMFLASATTNSSYGLGIQNTHNIVQKMANMAPLVRIDYNVFKGKLFVKLSYIFVCVNISLTFIYLCTQNKAQ